MHARFAAAFVGITIAVTLLFAGSTPALAQKGGNTQPTYTFTELLGGDESEALAINNPNAGNVVLIGGIVYGPPGDFDPAALWSVDAGTKAILNLELLPTETSPARILAVNDFGFAVGYENLPAGFVHVPGVGIRSLPAAVSAYGINSFGNIVGWWTVNPQGDRNGGLWHVNADGTITGPIDLGSFLPKGINDDGLMCGQHDGCPAIAWFDVADELQVQHLAATNGWGMAINNLGDVVGGRYLWETATGKTIDLGGGSAYAVNDRRQVVGAINDRQGNPRAYLWQSGKMSDLNGLVPSPPKGVKRTLTFAVGINEAGQIVGRTEYQVNSGSVWRGFLMSPNL